MSFRHRFAGLLLVGLILLGALALPVLGQMEGPPAMTAPPPQQMPVYGPPATTASQPQQMPAYGAPAVPAPPPQQMPVYGSPAVPASPPQQMPVYGSPAMPASPPQQMPVYGSPESPVSPPPQVPVFRSPGGSSYAVDPALAAAAPSFSAVPPDDNRTPADPGPVFAPSGSLQPLTGDSSAVPGSQADLLLSSDEPWQWQLLPTGLMYKSYLAGGREPRLGSELVHERTHGWYWDATVGARVGIVRYGTENDLWPQGWQFDLEGAAFPRLDLEHNEDLTDVDFRGGLLSTTRTGPIETKFGFYHISSHLGDEYILRYPSSLNTRINYVRESLIAGMAVYVNPSLRLYSEVGWTFQEDGGAKPWEFQFGADYVNPEPTGVCGTPFFAINAHLRQENNFGGNLTVQTGWAWRGRSGHLFRLGMQYFTGMSDQYQFYNQFEEEIGFGVWYDY